MRTRFLACVVTGWLATASGLVAVAAYEDYGPGYIGTAAAYEQGGYETSPASSNVALEVEEVLLNAMRKLLQGGP